jgi:peptidoglycan DL-endopeptidase CwlO
MKRNQLLWLLLGGAALAYWYANRNSSSGGITSSVGDSVSNITDSITAAIAGWKNVGSGAQWIPYLNQAEDQYGLPADLLARIAYQESRFRDDIIRGTKVSPAGALGLMQMMPAYFQSVNVPRPYTDTDVVNQIDEAARLMVANFQSTKSWPLAIAAYNAGLGNVKKYAGIPPFAETQNYVAQVTADVPSLQNVA